MMVSFFSAAALVLSGILLNVLAVILPARIQHQDAVWLSEAIDSAKPTRPSLRSLARAEAFKKPGSLMLFALPTVSWFAASAYVGPDGKALGLAVLLCGLGVVAVVDWRTHLLPDALVLPLTGTGLLAQLSPHYQTVGLEASVLGLVLAHAVLGGLSFFMSVVGRNNALGDGDIKLLALIGVWFGPLFMFVALFSGSVFALLANGIVIFRGRKGWQGEFPFGPWLVAAVYFMFGTTILNGLYFVC